MSKRSENYSFEPIQDFKLPSKEEILSFIEEVAREKNEHRNLRLKQELHDEETYTNDAIQFQDKVTFTASPSSDVYVAPVLHSESLAKELEERDKQLKVEKHSRKDTLKWLRD